MDIVQLSQQAEVMQPIQAKGYLDNEREMRIFLPRPALIALGRMQMSVQLYLEVKQDLIRPGSVEGSSAKWSGFTSWVWGSWGHSMLLCHRLGPGSGVAPQLWYPSCHTARQASVGSADCGAGGQSPWGDRLLCPPSGSLGPLSPSIPAHCQLLSFCCNLCQISLHVWSPPVAWGVSLAAIAVPLITAHPKRTLSSCVLRAAQHFGCSCQ